MKPYEFEIVDFHTHPYLCPEQSLCMYEQTVPETTEEMDRQLRAFGVDRICGSVLRKDWKFSMEELNGAALRLREKLGERYIPGFHIHPGQVEESAKVVREMTRRGDRLIGELVPYMHQWSEQCTWEECNRRLSAILEEAGSHPLVVSFHTMWEYPIEPLIEAHPDVWFVAAHPGERPGVEKQIARMRQYDNVCLDLSGTGIFRFGCIRRLVDQAGAERILFGTDYPICNPRMYIQAVLGENLGGRVNELIFSGNAKRVLGLDAR